jgi:hypothetical protein
MADLAQLDRAFHAIMQCFVAAGAKVTQGLE